MIVVTLGVPGSASTWTYNVCRELMAEQGATTAGFLRFDSDLDAAMAGGTPHMVLKAHVLSRALYEKLGQLDARMIVTLRDPRDGVISLMERFDFPLERALREVMRSAACIAMVGESAHHIARYEDRFWERSDIVDELCTVLGIDPPETLRRQVAANNSRESLENFIAAMPSLEPGRLAAHDGIVYDTVTHWHPNHLGDGVVGKWAARLPSAAREVVAAGFGWFAAGGYELAATRWLPETFGYRARRHMGEGMVALDLRLYRDAAIHGPDLFLAPGSWRAIFDLDAAAETDIEVDIAIGNVPVAAQRVTMKPGTPHPVLTFDHSDPAARIECRLFLRVPDWISRLRLSLRDPRAVRRVRFGGVALELLPQP